MQLDIKAIVFPDGTWFPLVEMEEGDDGVWTPKIQEDQNKKHQRVSDVGLDMSKLS